VQARGCTARPGRRGPSGSEHLPSVEVRVQRRLDGPGRNVESLRRPGQRLLALRVGDHPHGLAGPERGLAGAPWFERRLHHPGGLAVEQFREPTDEFEVVTLALQVGECRLQLPAGAVEVTLVAADDTRRE